MQKYWYDQSLLCRPDYLGPEGITLMDRDWGLTASFFKTRRDQCGYYGKIHGGILVTMLDDSLARCAELAARGILLTADVRTTFKAPATPDTLLAVWAKVVKHDGRKVWVQGWLVSVTERPVMVAEATGLFIQARESEGSECQK
ncbi:hypothetical protein JX265_013966 [Neoarthrinium moseri]|uniref:Thioesterase domain-containing protein n=1 Tax=Neoarthrinium moseri TaxID=1658444 RepID=A0A9Q0AI64_9PEZI|nr:uncharacterized protein JN550_013816 [Neoarthrinium moseri]KAI1839486.1 hypothetical protein JX266_014303 [Neoarthrinium moseri]KAI1847461.1 hypothetical protein JX265_013966 [Neoarthrinium moseri]KAI1856463.1 hypothetical protein JN550_013816 [Neoarthrinium moseri]